MPPLVKCHFNNNTNGVIYCDAAPLKEQKMTCYCIEPFVSFVLSLTTVRAVAINTKTEAFPSVIFFSFLLVFSHHIINSNFTMDIALVTFFLAMALTVECLIADSTALTVIRLCNELL